MIFERLLYTYFLSLFILQASLCFCLDNLGIFNPNEFERIGQAKSEAISFVSQIRSIDPQEQTFENFVFPWYRIRSKILSEADGFERLQEILQEVDPHGLLPVSMKDYSDRHKGVLNDLQRYILEKIQSSPQPGIQELVYISGHDEESDSQNEEIKNGDFTVLHTCIPPTEQGSLDEAIRKILESEPDVVCIQEITNEETLHRLYDQLQNKYKYLCIEEPYNNHPCSFIASKYQLQNVEEEFLDDNGIFVEVDVIDNRGEIARILMARPDRAPSAEALDDATAMVINKIHRVFLPYPAPTLLCCSFSRIDTPPNSFEALTREYFQNEEATNTLQNLLLGTCLEFSQKVSAIPLTSEYIGLLSAIHSSDPTNLYRAMNRGIPASHGHASAEASGSTNGDSHAGVSVGAYGDGGGWSVEAYGGISHDRDGHTSGNVGVSVDVPF